MSWVSRTARAVTTDVTFMSSDAGEKTVDWEVLQEVLTETVGNY